MGADHGRPIAVSGFNVGLLDRFSVRAGGRLMRLPAACQRLIAMVALDPDDADVSTIRSVLWHGSAPDIRAARLRAAMWRVRRECPGLLTSRERRVRIVETAEVDVRSATEVAAAVLRDEPGPASGDAVTNALRWLEEDLLPDWSEPWLEPHQRRHRELRLCALERLAKRLLVQGLNAYAIEAALHVIRDDPYRESAYQLLIAVHVSEGNNAEALQRFRALRRTLHEELGVEPTLPPPGLAVGLRFAPTAPRRCGRCAGRRGR
jgi:DNA-binding SARP family transcriptional activator